MRPAISLMQMESAPRSASSRPMATKDGMSWTGLIVYEMVACTWPPSRLAIRMENSMLRMSFNASKMRNTSTPLRRAQTMNRSTMSSG